MQQTARPAVLSGSLVFLAFAFSAANIGLAQSGPPPEPRDGPPQGEPAAPRGDRRGGGGPPMQREDRKLVAQFDKDGDKRLNSDERAAARTFIKEENAKNAAADGPRGEGPRPGGPARGFGGRRRDSTPPVAGPKLQPDDVEKFPQSLLFDPTVLRTFFFEFENADWEQELSDFHGTDVEVPARVIVDGVSLPGVGVRFRGASSYFMIPAGYKRSLNVSADFSDSKQRILGAKTLNLLNGNGDPSFLSSVLYSTIARNYLPAPQANLVKVVINGESWGVYSNAQQFDKEFLAQWYPSGKGVRWKVPGSPRGGGGLAYEGEELASYERLYEIKTDDNKDAKRGWEALIRLCRTLQQTPPEELEAALAPMLDVDGVLRFLAVENATMNSDGYWTRGSDFSLFMDQAGVFHVIPHDMNECFQPIGGRGGPGGPGGRGGPPGGERGERGTPGATVDPLAGIDDAKKPLISRLLAVPALRERYLGYVADIAKNWLDWKVLEPIVAGHAKLIEKEIEADTRKLETTQAFRQAVGLDPVPAPTDAETGPARRSMSLREFVDARRKFLLENEAIVQRGKPGGTKH